MWEKMYKLDFGTSKLREASEITALQIKTLTQLLEVIFKCMCRFYKLNP